MLLVKTIIFLSTSVYTELQDLQSRSAFIRKKLSDPDEINIPNLYKKEYGDLCLCCYKKLENYG